MLFSGRMPTSLCRKFSHDPVMQRLQWLETEDVMTHVDPESRIPCASDQVGEIWVASPNIAQGYWGKAEETEPTFHAYLQSGEDPFLRAEDLRFFWQGELFIIGRFV